MPPDQLIVPFGIDLVPNAESSTVAVNVIGFPTTVTDGFVILVAVDLLVIVIDAELALELVAWVLSVVVYDADTVAAPCALDV